MQRLAIALFATVPLIFCAVRHAPAASLTCLTGSDPIVGDDLAQILAVRQQVDAACVCPSFDGSRGKTHRDYVKCAREVIRLQIPGDLRPQCVGAVKSSYARSTCGRNPAVHAAPCVETDQKTGRITCRIKPTTRRDGVTPATACLDTPGKTTRAACPGLTQCIDAADTNGDFVISAPGDNGACVPSESPVPGGVALISWQNGDTISTLVTDEGGGTVKLQWIPAANSLVNLVVTYPGLAPLDALTLPAAPPTLEAANTLAAVIVGLNSGSSRLSPSADGSILPSHCSQTAGCDGELFGIKLHDCDCTQAGSCCDCHDACINAWCKEDKEGTHDLCDVNDCLKADGKRRSCHTACMDWAIFLLCQLDCDMFLNDPEDPAAHNACHTACLAPSRIACDAVCDSLLPICSPKCSECHTTVVGCFLRKDGLACPFRKPDHVYSGAAQCCCDHNCDQQQECVLDVSLQACGGGDPPACDVKGKVITDYGVCTAACGDLAYCKGSCCPEGHVCTDDVCTPSPCVDNDGDGYGAAGSANCPHPEVDCVDSDKTVHPGAKEICGDHKDSNCDGKDCGDNNGDPHIFTLDGMYYDNQLIGEFVVTREIGGAGFELQARQGRLAGWSPCVTFNTAVAMGLDSNVLQYTAESDTVLVDGLTVELAENETITLSGGAQVTRSQGVICHALSGSEVTVRDFGSYLNIRVNAPLSLTNSLEGLMGNFDGVGTNETILRSGEQSPDIAAFMVDWRVQDAESLFTYAPGENTATYTGIQDCNIHLSGIDIEGARQLCIAQFGEGVCDDAKVLAIATDLAAGMTVEQVAEWTGDAFPGIAASVTRWYQDTDGDGCGNINAYLDAVTQPTGYVSDNSDCDDTTAAIRPGRPEICDGIDNNCSGRIDEGCGHVNLTGAWDMHHTITGNTEGCGPLTCIGSGIMHIVQEGTVLPASFTITDYSGTQDCGAGSIPFSGTGTGTIDSQGNLSVGVLGFSSGCSVSTPSVGSSDGRTMSFAFSGGDLSCLGTCGAGSGDGSFTGSSLIPRCETTLLDEGFENCSVGTWVGNCNNWQTWANGTNPSHFFITDQYHVGGTHGLQVYGYPQCWEGATHKPVTGAHILLTAMIRASGEPVGCHGRQNAIALYPVADWTFWNSGLFCSAAGGGSFKAVEGFQNAANKWYAVAIELDYAAGMAYFWLDGARIWLTEFNTQVPVERVQLNSGDGHGWFDDIRACQVGEQGMSP